MTCSKIICFLTKPFEFDVLVRFWPNMACGSLYFLYTIEKPGENVCTLFWKYSLNNYKVIFFILTNVSLLDPDTW